MVNEACKHGRSVGGAFQASLCCVSVEAAPLPLLVLYSSGSIFDACTASWYNKVTRGW